MKNNKNAVYGIVGAGLALALFCLMFAACPEPETADKKEDPKYIRISVEMLEFGPYEETRVFSVETNADEVDVFCPEWCTVEDLGNGSYSVKVSAFSDERTGTVTLSILQDQQTADLFVAQYGYAPPPFNGEDDNSGFDYSTIFTDISYSKLKEGVTREAINAIPDLFFKDIALKLFLNIYDGTGFRAQEYRAWVHPERQAAATRTLPYSLRDNPTGIYVKKDDDLLVFADTQGQSVSLLSQDLSTEGGWWTNRNEYPLMDGINRIKARKDGSIYVQYYSDLGENAPKIRLNFVTGAVNGYFDSQKHQPGEWSRLLNAAVAPDFDLVGKFAHLTFPVASFKANTPDGKALIDAWDEMVRLEHEFMGVYKYNKLFTNRLYGHYCETGWFYAESYHTGYHPSAAPDILNVGKFKTSGIWGPAHEVGHINQVTSGVNWRGMREVTTNIYSLHVQTSFGNPSRMLDKSDGSYANTYAKAFDTLLGKNKPHNGQDAFVQLIPFWQLKLYLCDALGKTDFYKDLLYHMMTSPNPGSAAETDGRYQLNFVRVVCSLANLDLTDFFQKWGFLTPIDTRIENNQFTITQAQIDALKAEIAAKNYPKPEKDVTGITDTNVNSYK